MTLSDDDRLIREFILLMKLGQVDAGYFQEKFGVNIFTRFAEPLKHHAANGYLTLGDGAPGNPTQYGVTLGQVE